MAEIRYADRDGGPLALGHLGVVSSGCTRH
jgi:hypothetical protein